MSVNAENTHSQSTRIRYGGNGPTISVPAQKKPGEPSGVSRRLTTPEPDFTKMTTAEKLAYQKKRWDRILGGS